ncbi:hypothetical protein C8R46DRAFT_1037918 [Mycena filopes]|nr:hypothetical protein C8R46DRAFT_1037918 [Mycena filopes]
MVEWETTFRLFTEACLPYPGTPGSESTLPGRRKGHEPQFPEGKCQAQVSAFADIWGLWRVHCVGWKVHREGRFQGPVGGNTSFPLLVIGNTADPVTPLVWARKAASRFPSSVLLTQDSPGRSSAGDYSHPGARLGSGLLSWHARRLPPSLLAIARDDCPGVCGDCPLRIIISMIRVYAAIALNSWRLPVLWVANATPILDNFQVSMVLPIPYVERSEEYYLEDSPEVERMNKKEWEHSRMFGGVGASASGSVRHYGKFCPTNLTQRIKVGLCDGSAFAIDPKFQHPSFYCLWPSTINIRANVTISTGTTSVRAREPGHTGGMRHDANMTQEKQDASMNCLSYPTLIHGREILHLQRDQGWSKNLFGAKTLRKTRCWPLAPGSGSPSIVALEGLSMNSWAAVAYLNVDASLDTISTRFLTSAGSARAGCFALDTSVSNFLTLCESSYMTQSTTTGDDPGAWACFNADGADNSLGYEEIRSAQTQNELASGGYFRAGDMPAIPYSQAFGNIGNRESFTQRLPVLRRRI